MEVLKSKFEKQDFPPMQPATKRHDVGNEGIEETEEDDWSIIPLSKKRAGSGENHDACV